MGCCLVAPFFVIDLSSLAGGRRARAARE